MTTATVPQFTILDRLTKARVFAGYSQDELAEALGVSLSTVRRHETGRLAIKQWQIIAWAATCGVDPEWIVTGTVTGDDTHEYVTDCTGQLHFALAA